MGVRANPYPDAIAFGVALEHEGWLRSPFVSRHTGLHRPTKLGSLPWDLAQATMANVAAMASWCGLVTAGSYPEVWTIAE